MRTLWSAVWLGLLDTDDLEAITFSSYMGDTGFGEEAFNVHQGLWPWEARAVREHLADCEHVLVAGAGGGREVIALAGLGHDVTAFDSSPRLADACRRNLELAGHSALVLDALPSRLPDGLGTFDGLLIGRGVYHHIPGRGRRIEFLEACHAHLSAGSPIIVSDFFTREPGSVFHHRIRAIASLIRRLRGSKEHVELGDWLSDCMQHAFTREELEKELVDAGIHVDVYAVSPFSEDSQLAHAVGRATSQRTSGTAMGRVTEIRS